MRRIAVLLALLLGACATPPERIKASGSGGTCTQADRERLEDLYAMQSKAATGDALGVLMIGVPLGSGDYEPEIARLKGRCGDLPKKKPS